MVAWAELMTELVQRLVVELWKEKKTGSPLLVYISHLYSKYQVLHDAEQNDYNDAVKLLEYGGSETESEEESGGQSPSPPKEPQKRVRAEETPTEEKVAGTPWPESEQAQTPRANPEASGSGTTCIEVPEPPKLNGNIDEDISSCSGMRRVNPPTGLMK